SNQKRSQKLPDPDKLTDGTNPSYEEWKYKLEARFRQNDDHFKKKIRHQGRSLSLSYILFEKSTKRTIYVSDALEHMDSIYCNPNEALDARDKLRTMKLTPAKKFIKFRAEFTCLAYKSLLPSSQWIDEFHYRMYASLKIIMVPWAKNPNISFKEY
ncbi:hypothetical protein AOQ84DRAFT_264947, partial [Glonium stellatum]